MDETSSAQTQASNKQTNNIMPVSQRQRMRASAFVMAMCTLFSRVIGFVRTGVISAYFGATATADVLNLVLSIPNNFRKLFAEGALSNAFMPLFARTLKKTNNGLECTRESQVFFGGLLFWVGIPAGMLMGVLSIFSRFVVMIFFHFNSLYSLELASRIFSITIFFLFFMMLSSIAAGIQQVHKKFFVSSAAPIVFSLCVITVVIALASRWGVYAAAAGYVAGGAAQTTVLFLYLRSLGYRCVLYPRMSALVKQTFLQAFPIALALVIPIIGQQVAFYLASTLEEGSGSVFAYAIVFWQLPIGVVFNSIIAVGFSYVVASQHKSASIDAAARRERNAYKQNSAYALMVFAVPLTILMVFFAHAGVAVTLQRGQLESNDVYRIAMVLRGYAAGMVPFALYQATNKFLYAEQKARAVFAGSILVTTVDIALSLLLMRTNLRIAGLSYAYSISCMVAAPWLCYYLYKVTGCVLLRARDVFKIVVANIPLCIVSFAAWGATRAYWYDGSTIFNGALLAGIAFILGAVCIIGYKGVGISVITMVKSYRKR